MKFQTNITDVKRDGTEVIRGKKLTDIIASNSFTQTIFLILQGRMPSKEEESMMDAIFSSIIDHGPAVASAMNTRVAIASKNPMHTAIAAGILGFGERHGVALEAVMKFFYDSIDTEDLSGLLTEMKSRREYAPGFGHKIFEEDPRSSALFTKAKESGFFGKHCEFAHAVHSELNKLSSSVLPINVDGAIGAILCDMGFDSRLGRGIFVIGRVPGLVAHAFEEMSNDVGVRRADPEDIEYTGK